MNAELLSRQTTIGKHSRSINHGKVEVSEPFRYGACVSRIVSIQAPHAVYDMNAWSDLEITLISGQCQIQVNDETDTLTARQSRIIPAMVEHSIVAITDARLVLSFRSNATMEANS